MEFYVILIRCWKPGSDIESAKIGYEVGLFYSDEALHERFDIQKSMSLTIIYFCALCRMDDA
jgi:hypothetical protein